MQALLEHAIRVQNSTKIMNSVARINNKAKWKWIILQQWHSINNNIIDSYIHKSIC